MKERAMTCDPGLQGTGLAWWYRDELVDTLVLPPFPAKGVPGFWGEPNDKELTTKLVFLANAIIKEAQAHSALELYIEQPRLFGSAAGHMVAAKGDLGKLEMLVGAVVVLAWNHSIEPHLVPVNTWKGQLPKDVVESRIRRKLGEAACAGIRSHAWDAVGIGLHLRGEF